MTHDDDALRRVYRRASGIGDTEFAAYVLDELLRLDPNSPQEWAALGRNYQELGRWTDAELAFRRALALNPQNDLAWLALGAMYADRSMWANAEECMMAILRCNAGNLCKAYANFYIGYVLAAQEREPEAEAYYQAAIAQRPDYAEAHYNLGVTLLALERRNEAAASFQRAIACDPSYDRAAAALKWMKLSENSSGLGSNGK